MEGVHRPSPGSRASRHKVVHLPVRGCGEAVQVGAKVEITSDGAEDLWPDTPILLIARKARQIICSRIEMAGEVLSDHGDVPVTEEFLDSEEFAIEAREATTLYVMEITLGRHVVRANNYGGGRWSKRNERL